MKGDDKRLRGVKLSKLDNEIVSEMLRAGDREGAQDYILAKMRLFLENQP